MKTTTMCTDESCTIKPGTLIKKVQRISFYFMLSFKDLCIYAMTSVHLQYDKSMNYLLFSCNQKWNKALKSATIFKTISPCQTFTKISLTTSSPANNSMPGKLGRIINNGKVHFHLGWMMGRTEKGCAWMSEGVSEWVQGRWRAYCVRGPESAAWSELTPVWWVLKQMNNVFPINAEKRCRASGHV